MREYIIYTIALNILLRYAILVMCKMPKADRIFNTGEFRGRKDSELYEEEVEEIESSERDE